jgi:hypothetical protein
MADETTVAVKSSKVTDPLQVVIWDVDEAHPAGEVFIYTDGKTHEVARTPTIIGKIESGELSLGSKADVKALLEAPDPAKDETRAAGLAPDFENPGGPRVVSHDQSTATALAAARAEAEADEAKGQAKAAAEEAERAAEEEEARVKAAAKEGVGPVTAEAPVTPVRIVADDTQTKPAAPAKAAEPTETAKPAGAATKDAEKK